MADEDEGYNRSPTSKGSLIREHTKGEAHQDGLERERRSSGGILRLDPTKPRRRSSATSFEYKTEDPTSPCPSDRLSVTWADGDKSIISSDTSVVIKGKPENLSENPSINTIRTASTPRSPPPEFFGTKGNFDREFMDDDLEESVSVILERSASLRSSKKKSKKKKRRTSNLTSSSGESTSESETEGSSAKVKVFREVLAGAKQQPWPMKKKLTLVRTAREFLTQHEGELEQRLAKSSSTKDVLYRYFIVLRKLIQTGFTAVYNWIMSVELWEGRIKTIESHFGSAVASYFTFLRWVIGVNAVIAILLAAFVIIPEILAVGKHSSGERKIMLEGESTSAFDLKVIWDFDGILRYSPIFYGFYSKKEKTLEGYRVPLAYILTSMCVYGFSFVAILRKMAANSRLSKLGDDDATIFTFRLFSGWDFTIGNSETAHNKVASINIGFRESLLEAKEADREVKSWKVTVKRCLAHILVVCLLLGSAYAVILLVDRSKDVDSSSSWWRQNELTVTLTMISIVFPNLFDLVGLLETHHPRKQLQWQLARIMALNLLNLYTLIFALFGKVNDMSSELMQFRQELENTGIVQQFFEGMKSTSTETTKSLDVTATLASSFATLSTFMYALTVTDSKVFNASHSPDGDTSTIDMIDAMLEVRPGCRKVKIACIPSMINSTTFHNITNNGSTLTKNGEPPLSPSSVNMSSSFERKMYSDNVRKRNHTTVMNSNIIDLSKVTDYLIPIMPSHISNSLTVSNLMENVTASTISDSHKYLSTYESDIKYLTKSPMLNDSELLNSGEIAYTNISLNGTPTDTVPLDTAKIGVQNFSVPTSGVKQTNVNPLSDLSKAFPSLMRPFANFYPLHIPFATNTTESWERFKRENGNIERLKISEFTDRWNDSDVYSTDNTMMTTDEQASTTTESQTVSTEFLYEESNSFYKVETEATGTPFITTNGDNYDLNLNYTDFTTINISQSSNKTNYHDYDLFLYVENTTAYDTSIIPSSEMSVGIDHPTSAEPSPEYSTSLNFGHFMKEFESSSTLRSNLVNETTTSGLSLDGNVTQSLSPDLETINYTINTDEYPHYQDNSFGSDQDCFTYIEVCNDTINATEDNWNETYLNESAKTTQASILLETDMTTGMMSEITTISTTVNPEYLVSSLSMRNRTRLRRLCWETMFGQEIIKLSVMDLVLTVITIVVTDYLRAVIVRTCNNCCCWDLEKQFPGYPDFKIAENILHLVNNQGMIWMGMFFAPGLPALNLVKLVLLFYVRSWAVVTANVPPETVFKASDNNNFYLSLLLIMLFLCTLPVGYAVVWLTPSWHCGPFSDFRKIYQLATETFISSLPDWFEPIIDYISSPGVVIPAGVLLILIIYYLLSLTAALREAVQDLKDQLRRERNAEKLKAKEAQTKRAETPTTKWRRLVQLTPLLQNQFLEIKSDIIKSDQDDRTPLLEEEYIHKGSVSPASDDFTEIGHSEVFDESLSESRKMYRDMTPKHHEFPASGKYPRAESKSIGKAKEDKQIIKKTSHVSQTSHQEKISEKQQRESTKSGDHKETTKDRHRKDNTKHKESHKQRRDSKESPQKLKTGRHPESKESRQKMAKSDEKDKISQEYPEVGVGRKGKETSTTEKREYFDTSKKVATTPKHRRDDPILTLGEVLTEKPKTRQRAGTPTEPEMQTLPIIKISKEDSVERSIQQAKLIRQVKMDSNGSQDGTSKVEKSKPEDSSIPVSRVEGVLETDLDEPTGSLAEAATGLSGPIKECISPPHAELQLEEEDRVVTPADLQIDPETLREYEEIHHSFDDDVRLLESDRQYEHGKSEPRYKNHKPPPLKLPTATLAKPEDLTEELLLSDPEKESSGEETPKDTS